MTARSATHDRIARLFDGFRHQGTPTRLDPMVAAHINAVAGVDFTAVDVEALRTRPVEDATTDVLEAVASYFDVPASYLTGTAAEQADFDSQLDYFDNVRQSQATVFALRTRVPQLTPDIAERLSLLVRDTHERFEVSQRCASVDTGCTT